MKVSDILNTKILINIKVPMLEEEYCIFIPVSKNIYITTQLLSKAINEFTKGYFSTNKNHLLMTENGNILDFYTTIKKSGIKNGDTLFLI